VAEHSLNFDPSSGVPGGSVPVGRDETLIRQYLFAVDPVIRHRANAADVRDELADHLIETVARLCAVGVDSDTAERLTPSRFGEPAVTAGFINAIPAEGHTVHALFTTLLGLIWLALTVLVLVGVALVSPPQPAGTGTRIDSPRGVRRQGFAAGVPRLCRRPRGVRRAPAFPLPEHASTRDAGPDPHITARPGFGAD